MPMSETEVESEARMFYNRRGCILLWAAAVIVALVAVTEAAAQTKSNPSGAPGNEEHVLKFGRDRTYWMHLPPSADETKKLPLVVFFHGAGGHGRWAAGETGWNAKAD